MLDLIMRRGQQQAYGHQQSGNVWGNALANIGQTLGAGIQQYGETQQRKKQSIAFEEAIQSGDPRRIISVLGPERGPAVVTALKTTTPDAAKLYKDRQELFRDGARGILASPKDMQAQGYGLLRQSYIQNGFAKPEELPEAFEEALPFVHQAANYGREPEKAPGTRQVTRRNADGSEVTEIVADVPGQSFESAPPEPKRHMVTVPGPNGPVQRLATEQELAAGVQAYREPRAPRAEEPLVPVMDPVTGRPVLRRRSQAEGLAPASSREQGRPVTSGDATRISELDTSLDDLNVLRGAVTGSGATGTSAKIGAALWNPITEATGIGAEAKAKQAAIDRVKQVIGKALEGGVLRKEDEAKYEKILPTIGDVPEVVEAKLAGLEKAIALRRQRQLESLADAGYDTAQFSARTQGGPAATPAPARGGQPPLVNSPEEAARLPRGSTFRTPDGQIRVVP